MTSVFFLILLCMTGFFCLFNSQYIGSPFPAIIYGIAVAVLTTIFWLRERRLRRKMLGELQNVLENNDFSHISESEIAPIARQLQLKRHEEELRDQRITESYRHLSSLLSDIAHQCKTPLTAIHMYAEMLPGSAESAAIQEQTDKLTFLLDALVKLSRCEGGLIAENVHPADNSIESLLLASLPGVIPAAEAKNISLATNIPAHLSAIFDLRWTSEALVTLLDNAVKYSPEHTTITLSAVQYDTYIRLDVTDEGPGIPEEELSDIWKRFYRGKNTNSRSGVGIGLTLCRMILQAQHGRVHCTSKPGHGSTFSMFLPISSEILQN